MLVRELRNKSNKELLKLIEDLKAQLFMLRFQNKTGQLDKPHKIPNIKKDIAKIFTIINARELNLEKRTKLNDKTQTTVINKNVSKVINEPLANKEQNQKNVQSLTKPQQKELSKQNEIKKPKPKPKLKENISKPKNNSSSKLQSKKEGVK